MLCHIFVHTKSGASSILEMYLLILMINFVKHLCESFVVMLDIDLYVLQGQRKQPCMLQC